MKNEMKTLQLIGYPLMENEKQRIIHSISTEVHSRSLWRRFVILLLVTLTVSLSSCGPEPFCIGEPGVNAAEGRITVRFTDEVDTEERAHEIVEGHGLKILFFYTTPTSAAVETPLGEECKYVWRLQDHPDVEYAMLSLILTIH